MYLLRRMYIYCDKDFKRRLFYFAISVCSIMERNYIMIFVVCMLVSQTDGFVIKAMFT